MEQSTSDRRTTQNNPEGGERMEGRAWIRQKIALLDAEVRNQLRAENQELKAKLQGMEEMMRKMLAHNLPSNPTTPIQRVETNEARTTIQPEVQSGSYMEGNQISGNKDGHAEEEEEVNEDESTDTPETELRKERAAATAYNIQLPGTEDDEESVEGFHYRPRKPKSINKKQVGNEYAVKKSFKMSSNLPKFRGNIGMQDAEEFINKFVRVCQANCLEEPTFSTMLLTCLEEVNASWLERWLDSTTSANNREPSWNQVKKEFLKFC